MTATNADSAASDNAPLAGLAATVRSAAHAVRGSAGAPSAQARLERSKRDDQGDYSTNAAMLGAATGRGPDQPLAPRVTGRPE